ncbi:GxxExxY protein [Rhodohalobacter halophilus]|uniref:GxxExxY protein n=1 Tax=Rhodohalobacter halophilus TaxID=1812810 RepID=UPI00083F8EAB|nr:GxxExxY protein [Rhodohalobacter halophilus]
MVEENKIAASVVNSAIRVHRELGPGLLESAYQAALSHVLINEGFKVEKEKPQHIYFEGERIDCGYRIDLLINDKVIVELKAVESLKKIHTAQILTYLKLSGCRLGIILNFNVRLLKHGIKRVIL